MKVISVIAESWISRGFKTWNSIKGFYKAATICLLQKQSLKESNRVYVCKLLCRLGDQKTCDYFVEEEAKETINKIWNNVIIMPPYFLVLNLQYLQLHILLCTDPLVAWVLLTGDPEHSFMHSTERGTSANNLSARMHSDF